MASTAYSWIFGLVTLFGIGVLFIVFSQVFTAHLVPEIKEQINDSTTIDVATKTDTKAKIDKYMDFFNTMPFILFVVVVVFMFIAAIRKEGESL